jgi:hypothetical protein
LTAKRALPQKHKVQLLEDPNMTVTKKSATPPKPSKPLSSDDIKKAKLKEKLINPDSPLPEEKVIIGNKICITYK